MRKLTTALATLALATTFAQCAAAKIEAEPFPMDATGRIVFTGVVQVEGATAADLYSRAKFWTTKMVDNVTSTIALDEPALGRLVIFSRLFANPASPTFERTTIEVKDGRYRWKIDQLRQLFDGGSMHYEPLLTKEGIGSKSWGLERCEMDRRLLLVIISELQASMVAAPEKW